MKLYEVETLENEVNDCALHTREFLINKLDYLDGELLEFVAAGNGENGVAAMDVKWKSGVHFIVYQTPWCVYYYAERNNGQISHTFRAGELKNDSPAYFQRLINDINKGRYDHKLTPGERHLKDVQEKGLTGYMNNTKWGKVFDVIGGMEEETGQQISIMYKCISDDEDPVYYWTVKEDEELYKGMYKYIEWLKVRPVVCECEYQGRLIEPKYTYYDYTALFLKKMNAINLRYEYLEQEEAYIIYGYR